MKVLLIGLSDESKIRRSLRKYPISFTRCSSLAHGQRELKKGIYHFFILGTNCGEAPAMAFLKWLQNSCRVPGVIIEEKVHNYLCIEAINSHLIFHYLTYGDPAERFDEIFVRFTDPYGRIIL